MEETEKKVVFDSLSDLVKEHPNACDVGRVYRVKVGEKEVFTISKSPGRAALNVCEVFPVAEKSVLQETVKSLREEKESQL